MSDKHLVVLLSGERLGTLTEDRHGKHWFAYDLDGPERTLSLSMPRRQQPWGPHQVEPFLDGLLPDNRAARNEIARHYDAVAGNTFSLLTAVGRDCAGAVQFLPPDKADEFDEGALIPVSDSEIANGCRISSPVGNPPGRPRASIGPSPVHRRKSPCTGEMITGSRRRARSRPLTSSSRASSI